MRQFVAAVPIWVMATILPFSFINDHGGGRVFRCPPHEVPRVGTERPADDLHVSIGFMRGLIQSGALHRLGMYNSILYKGPGIVVGYARTFRAFTSRLVKTVAGLG
jgi:hypothetical protein